jgi:Flp pilus assembly protein TadD
MRRLTDSCIALAAALTVLSGCATNTGSVPTPTAAQQEATSAKDRARVEVDAGAGFTVTEVVHIDGSVRTDYLAAIGLLQQNRLDEGIARLESVVQQAPDATTPHIDLGIAYARKGDYDKAEQSLKAALALTPDHPVALNELGMVYRHMGKFDAARASYEHALSIDPSYHYALRNLGVLCDLYLKDLQCALQNYQSYDALVGDDKEVKIWIADIQNRMKQPGQ